MALDDFGAGRGGLERLYSIRDVAAVKLDREFLVTWMKRPDACRILHMLVAQWRREGIKSIADGMETEEILAFAQAADVDLVQGWYRHAGENEPTDQTRLIIPRPILRFERKSRPQKAFQRTLVRPRKQCLESW